MSYDDIIEVLAAALLEKAETVGCLEVLDGFSQRQTQKLKSAPQSARKCWRCRWTNKSGRKSAHRF